jgi:hypothetical protein
LRERRAHKGLVSLDDAVGSILGVVIAWRGVILNPHTLIQGAAAFAASLATRSPQLIRNTIPLFSFLTIWLAVFGWKNLRGLAG